MRDVFWERVLAADGSDSTFAGFAGFGESVVARVKVFALLYRLDQLRGELE